MPINCKVHSKYIIINYEYYNNVKMYVLILGVNRILIVLNKVISHLKRNNITVIIKYSFIGFLI
jgi:hypothetical protein